MGKLCLTCESGNLIHSRSIGIAKWLTDAGRNAALPPNAPRASDTKRAKYPDTYSVNIRVKVGPPSLDGVKILFWAANPRSIRERVSHRIYGATKAYGNYENSGVAFIKKGYISIKLACPQSYKEEGNIPSTLSLCQRRQTVDAMADECIYRSCIPRQPREKPH